MKGIGNHVHFGVSYFHFHFYQFLAFLKFNIPNDRECNFLLFSYRWRWAKIKDLSDTFQLIKWFKKDRTFPQPIRVLIEKSFPGSNLHFQGTIPKDKTLEIWFSIENILNLVKLSKIQKSRKILKRKATCFPISPNSPWMTSFIPL